MNILHLVEFYVLLERRAGVVQFDARVEPHVVRYSLSLTWFDDGDTRHVSATTSPECGSDPLLENF